VILITGAGQRIGLFLAKEFIKQGEKVCFTYKTPRATVDDLVQKGAVGFQVDFTKEKQVNDFLKAFKTQVGSVKLLVHNASIWTKDEAMTPTSFKEMIAVHQLAPYQITTELTDQLKAYQGTADIIAIADSKIKSGHKDFVAYLSSKSGLKTLMDSFAKKLAPQIKVNTISSGLVIFNENDSEGYKKQRLAEMAIPLEPTEKVMLDAVQFIMKTPNTTGSNLELNIG